MDRRDFMRYGAAGIAGGAVGYGLLDQGTDTAEASLTMGSLAIDGDSATTKDGRIDDVTVAVDGTWQYDIPAENDVYDWQVALSVTDGERTATVDTASAEAMYLQSDGEYTVGGSLTTTPVYAADDFAAAEGEEATTDVSFELAFAVRNRDDDTLAGATLTETATVSVTNKVYEPSEFGEASGSGAVTIVDE
jgi:hypothetical protein